MDRRRTCGAGLSRLLVLCAVLFGLFAMHGAPASAAAGCHGETTVAEPMSAPMSPMSAPMNMGHADMRGERGLVHAGPVVSSMGGERCVSTPARDRLPLTAAGLFAVLGLVVVVVWGLAGRRAALRDVARRGPPRAGRQLLLEVCIART
ncbi:hypothetical protein DWB77_06759 [Streptomyces hundungensis]|uniref:Uncharacterized protein n=1 Tax=Streptomyces hundungensis TaxID=1077946 RepID=A0A387HL01_9ACTN|nr:hypothetical protein DWB77_06759 [Streptomyces hundungensis]